MALQHVLIRHDRTPDRDAIERAILADANRYLKPGEVPTPAAQASAMSYALDCAILELGGHMRDLFDRNTAHLAKEAAEDERRRKRLIDFLDRLGDERHSVRIGFFRVSYAVLTTDQLETVAQRACRDFWDDKRRRRENRAVFAARAAILIAAE